MNILYILQQSIYDKKGKWKTADSNVNMMVGMLKNVLKLQPDWNFYILIGRLKDFSDIKSYDEIFKHSNVHFIEYDFPVNAFYNRQHFDVKDFEKMWKKLPDIDIVWNNITELSRNIKTFLHYKKENPKLITTCYWLDAPEIGQEKVPSTISYDWRQFDGFECSDLAVFTCESTFKAWKKNAKNKFKKKYVDRIIDKSTIWDFGFSLEELNENVDESQSFDKKTILFLNRLSEINYTHHNEFIEALKLLKEMREDDWQVAFTNPSQKISWDELKKEVPNLYVYKEETLDRKEYFQLLHNSDISVHLFKKELYGGCANVESIVSGNIKVMPRIYEYKKRALRDYPGFIKSVEPNEIADAINKTLDMIDNKKLEKHIKYSKNYVIKNSSFESISKNVISDIEEVFNG